VGCVPARRQQRRADQAWRGVIRIAISQAAFEAIARTLPFGDVSFENKLDEHGQRLIWLPRDVLDRLRSLRAPGEDYSDVILRLAAESVERAK
jgi:hypothetical protein